MTQSQPRPRLLSTSVLPDNALGELEPGLQVETLPDEQDLPTYLATAETSGIEVLVALLSTRVDGTIIDKLPDLRVVANYAVGLDNLSVPDATARGVAVLNTPGVLTDATADQAMALLLCASRRLAEGDRLVREQRPWGWGPAFHLGYEVTGKTLGIVGMGRIGQAVARRALGFKMEILYSSRRRIPLSLETELGARRVALDELLRGSDFVSLHCPLTEETRGLIDSRAIELMKPTAVLVNTARGPVVDEAALARALSAGRIFSAGLDVYTDEPEVHPALLDLPNVVLAPHIGSATVETRAAMASLLVDGIKALYAGGRPANLVNPDALESRR